MNIEARSPWDNHSRVALPSSNPNKIEARGHPLFSRRAVYIDQPTKSVQLISYTATATEHLVVATCLILCGATAGTWRARQVSHQGKARESHVNCPRLWQTRGTSPLAGSTRNVNANEDRGTDLLVGIQKLDMAPCYHTVAQRKRSAVYKSRININQNLHSAITLGTEQGQSGTPLLHWHYY